MAHRSRSSRDYPRASRDYANGRSSRDHASSSREYTTEKTTRSDRRASLPQYNHNGHKVTKGMAPEGESGRRGFNPIKFLVISGRSSSTLSMLTNCLWPMVPVAIALVHMLVHDLSNCVLIMDTAFREAQVACCHLRHQLHRHVARRQSPRIRWSGAVPQDAPESFCSSPGDDFRFRCRDHPFHGPAQDLCRKLECHCHTSRYSRFYPRQHLALLGLLLHCW
jgi:hypothetical protein